MTPAAYRNTHLGSRMQRQPEEENEADLLREAL